MATSLALTLNTALQAAADEVITAINAPETRIPWPGQPRTLWPQADLSGRLSSGEVFIVEVDDQADPARSVLKYWPLLHAVDSSAFQHEPLCLIEVSATNATFGAGFAVLARFAGDRFERMYPSLFRFEFVQLDRRDTSGLCAEVLQALRRRLRASS